jgi:hypothetical protein
MKKLLIGLVVAVGVALPAMVLAATSPLPASYRAKYCYPSGTYWQSQIATYPDYYAFHDAQYQAQYGSTTRYCPAS